MHLSKLDIYSKQSSAKHLHQVLSSEYYCYLLYIAYLLMPLHISQILQYLDK